MVQNNPLQFLHTPSSRFKKADFRVSFFFVAARHGRAQSDRERNTTRNERSFCDFGRKQKDDSMNSDFLSRVNVRGLI